MRLIKKAETEEYSGDGYYGIDYPILDKDINIDVIKINGRSPKFGYQVNTKCKELLYIINGMGVLYNKANMEKKEFYKGDVIIIDKNEVYAFEGNFEAVVPCTPAWTKDQHKYIV